MTYCRPLFRRLAAALLLTGTFASAQAAPQTGRVALSGHLTPALASAHLLAPMEQSAPISLALTLKLRNQPQLTDLLRRLHTPADALYGQYLTPAQFTERFSPTQADYDAVAAYARAQGLTITGTSPNRLVLNVSGPARRVSSAFGVQLNRYAAGDGRRFYAASAAPQIPSALAGQLQGIIGLDNAAVWHSSVKFRPAAGSFALLPRQLGTGPGGGLTPSDIRKAYNLTSAPGGGDGQVLGLFQLDGYTLSDIRAYQSHFGLPSVPLQNVLVDGYSGAAGDGSVEVSLDIELQSALAPNVSKIVVYEGPNTGAGVLDTYNKIATDNIAKQVSSSWGLAETYSNPVLLNAENAIFQQMAAQGQTIYAAAGDSGAYDNGRTLSVDDPASQPFVSGVGGTALSVTGDGSYQSERTWSHGVGNGGGGGGVSSYWNKPDYQTGVGASAAKRNVPDVSLASDPSTGYCIAWRGGWYVVGGTSCAAPLWAAFTALVNQQRTQSGSPSLGFANPVFYGLGQSAGAALDFHDIADGSTNMYYAATAGYDNATGWGSFNGLNLLNDLSATGGTTPPPAPGTPDGLTARQDNTRVTLSWSPVAGAASYKLYRAAVSGGEGGTAYKTGLTSASYVDTGVVNNTRYFYQVAAVTSGGTSALSSEVSAVPQVPAQLAALSLSPAMTGRGASVTCTLTLASAAPPDGAAVTLASSSDLVAVPSSVTVPSGAKTATFTITTQAVTSPASIVIRASVGTGVKTATLTLQPVLSALTLSPASISGGGTVAGSVTLGLPAPAGGLTLTLSGSSAAASVPATVTVPAGKTSAAFTVLTFPVTDTASVTLTATTGSLTKTATLTVLAPTLATLTFNPSTLSGGAATAGTLTLSSTAPDGGAAVALTTSSTAVTVPDSVMVPAGAKTAAFSVTTQTVTASTAVTVYAAYHGTKTALLTLKPVSLTAFTVSPSSVQGGTAATGTVTLTSGALSGGFTVNVSSNIAEAVVPETVTVPEGKTTVTFSLPTTATDTGALGMITASAGSVTKNAPLTVQPPAIASVSITPTAIVGGRTALGTVTLTSIAPDGGAAVSLYSTGSGGNFASVPASVTVAAGTKTATFTLTTSAVTASTPTLIYAAYHGIKSATPTLLPVLASVTLAPTVTGGGGLTGTVILSAPAPDGGQAVGLTLSSGSSAAVPDTLTVPAGKTSATFPVTTTAVSSSAHLTLTAAVGSQSKTLPLTVLAPALVSVSLAASVHGGASAIGTVTLSGPAPDGGLTVTLSGGGTALSAPATVTVAAGAKTAAFTLTTQAVSVTTPVTLSAALSGLTKTVAVKVTH